MTFVVRTIRGFHFENLLNELTHLQYADDTLLFSYLEDGNLETWRRPEGGLPLNSFKTSLIGINLNSDDLASCTNILGCSVDSLPFNYLGFSTGEGRNRKEVWNALKE